MGMPPQNERGIDQKPEIKLFSEVTPEEIAKDSGGTLMYWQNGDWDINYDQIPTTIISRKQGNIYPNSMSGTHLVIEDGDTKAYYSLDKSVVISENGSVTFVDPAEENKITNLLRYSWTKLSKNGYSRSVENSRCDLDNDLISAARKAALKHQNLRAENSKK